jgi:hypothetical protein
VAGPFSSTSSRGRGAGEGSGGASRPQRGRRREPRAEEDSRLAGVPARRTCVAEIGRQSQAHRSPFENLFVPSQIGAKSPARRGKPVSCSRRAGGGWVEGDTPGHAPKGACPGALDDNAIVGRTAPWTFTGLHPRRKAWIGIDLALGSPSVLPKEGTPGRPIALSLHGGRVTAVSARAFRCTDACKGGVPPARERQGCQKLDRTKLPR